MLVKSLLSLSSNLLTQFLPPQCIFCGVTSRHKLAVCMPCYKELPILPQHCTRCALFIPTMKGASLQCAKCQMHPPAYRKVMALFPYEPPIVHLLLNLKFSQKLNYAQTFGEIMTDRIRQIWYKNKPLPDLILPVPLHISRLKERGFNQTLEIARPIAKVLNIPIDTSGVRRLKKTKAQSGLNAKDRKTNLRDAFRAEKNYSGLKIAILDDIVTTGTTIQSLSVCLQENGAENIDVWAVARRG